MSELRIAHVASEVAPYARTGGLGDVLGSLPLSLAQLGHDIRIFMPCYQALDKNNFPQRITGFSSSVRLGNSDHPFSLSLIQNRKQKVSVYLIESKLHFDRPGLYREPGASEDYPDNDQRFAFFCRAVLDFLKKDDWNPDIIHVHDWQTSLIPAYLDLDSSSDWDKRKPKSLLTIHNLAYQGLFAAKRFKSLGLPESYFRPMHGALEFYGKVSFLKAGISLADAVTTVSPTYAKEIVNTEKSGCGLQGVFRKRPDSVHGVLNGVDYTIWSPTRDKKIPYRFSLANLSGKRMTRVELLRRASLPLREGTPVIGIVSRLADQKGLDLIADAADYLFAMNIQLIVLGTGEKKYHDLLEGLQQKYPDKLRAFLKFDDELAHWIEAGADMFLMPSHFEPCGLNQMYSLKYGTVPIVRKTGGLADTVEEFNPDSGTGNGFLFSEYSSEAMLEAIARAVSTFSSKRVWTRLMKNGMRQDFSWKSSAQQYISIYRSLLKS